VLCAVASGERDLQVLVNYRDPRCKNSVDTIEKSSTGIYRNEHIFSLKQALELVDVYREKINARDDEIEKCLLCLNRE
jgi:hypothetical protein